MTEGSETETPVTKASSSSRSASSKPDESRNNAGAIALLRSWADGDEKYDRETLNGLMRNLDRHRSSARKLFPRSR